MQIISIKTRIFKERENLMNFILIYAPVLEEGDILAITSKIVALSQGRTSKIKNKRKIITASSKKIVETPWALLTETIDGWCINAGVDESNANKKLILLPSEPDKIAEQIRSTLTKQFKLKKIGVLITDTKSLPLRRGTIGRALAYAGFNPLKSYIGKKDLFGKKSRFTESNIADALSASAVLNMGEGREQIPIVIIKNAPIEFNLKKNKQQKKLRLAISPEKDIYSYIYKNNKK